MSFETRKWRRRAGTSAIAVALAVAVAPIPPAAADPSEPSSTGDSSPIQWPAELPDSATITLITGDKVDVRTDSDGRTGVTVTPARESSGLFRTDSGPDGELHVYPESVQPQLAAGLLDTDLFNVTRLVADGYDDAHRDSLPVIVDYTDSPSAKTLTKRTGDLPAVSDDVTPLTTIGAAATEVSKTDGEAFLDEVADGKVAHVWLDAMMEAELDESVPLIGAPEAYEAGYDGTDVTVAVLDTGVDLSHPDLAGQVVGSKSFIDGQDVQDGHGHGTHVAGTVAGTGAASDGKYAGVAPGADLLIGKVLDNAGSGPTSGIIAGMEWAVAEGADLVSMSLGGRATSTEDTLSLAVDTLSAASGVLFVIAAGNEGPYSSTLGSPGTAKTALTVAATDKKDKLADFSSRGPRPGDNGLKPEITAPGVGIVAPRAVDTSMGSAVGDDYTSANGTSMATPHVAGAAALLKQRHPDWNAAQLKDALVSTSKVLPGYSVYEQGAGRVNAGKAVTGSLFASATADLGSSKDGSGTLSREVTYTNTGDTDVTVDLVLNLDGGEKPADGAVGLSEKSLAVPAGDTAAVTIAADIDAVDYGRYNGHLLATADGVALTTAVAFIKNPPLREVTVNLADRAGEAPDDAEIYLLDVVGKDAYVLAGSTWQESRATLNVPQGTYSVLIRLSDQDEDTFMSRSIDYYMEPEMTIDSDVTIDADARQSVDFEPSVVDDKRDMQISSFYLAGTRTRDDGRSATMGHIDTTTNNDGTFGVIPSKTTAEHGTFALDADITLKEPVYTGKLKSGDISADLDLLWDPLMPKFEGERAYEAIDVGAGEESDYEGLDLTGKLAVISNGMNTDRVNRAAEHGATATLFTPDTPHMLELLYYLNDTDIPVFGVPYASGAKLRDALASGGPMAITVDGRLESRFSYLVPMSFTGKVPGELVMKTRKGDFAKVENKVYGEINAQYGLEVLSAWRSGQATSVKAVTYTNTPMERDDFLYAKDMAYQQTFAYSADAYTSLMTEPVTSYKAGKSYHSDWWRGARHAGVNVASPCGFCRTDTAMTFGVTALGDSDPDHFGTDDVIYRYYRDDAEITSGSLVVPEAATYRIEAQSDRTYSPWILTGTTIDTAWTFRSKAPADGSADGCDTVFGDAACAALPVILVGYDMPVDDLTRAKSNNKFTFDVTTDRATGYTGESKIDDVDVQVSYDDGESWSEADKVKAGDGGAYSVSVKHPKLSKTNGFASLRVTVADGDGNKTEQTIIRAYALK